MTLDVGRVRTLGLRRGDVCPWTVVSVCIAVAAAVAAPSRAAVGEDEGADSADSEDSEDSADGADSADSEDSEDSADGADSASKPVSDDPQLEAHRTPFAVLQDQFLGSASRAVRFDWRRSPAQIGLIGGELVERNNFGAFKIGALARKAFGDLMFEVGFARVLAMETTSSDMLALTPYRQGGRPSHFELEANGGLAVAEGVVTPQLSFVPPAELALLVWGGARYLIYPEGYGGTDLLGTGLNVVSPALSDDELRRISRTALPGMQVDRARLHTLVGASLDVYFQPGFLLSPRAMVALPIVAPATGSTLGFWWELAVVAGYAL